MKASTHYTFDLVAMGRACVDEYFLVEEEGHNNAKVPILRRKVCGGGQAATSAITVSKLGGRSAYLGNLGKDSFGDLVLQEFIDFGVNVDGVNRPDEFITPKALILVNSKNGDRTIYYDELSRRIKYPIPLPIISSTRALILDPEISPEELDQILESKAKDCIIVYDGERARPSLNAMMDNADFFIASETLMDIRGTSKRRDTFQYLKSKVKGELIFTFGEEGSVWVKNHELVHIPAMPVCDVLDTTGAGDVFHASFAYYYPQQKDVLKTLKLATYCASKSISHLGNRERKNLFITKEMEALRINEKLLSIEQFNKLIEARAS